MEALLEEGNRRVRLMRLALLWLIGIDLRIAVLAVPPVLPSIRRQFHLTGAAIGAITSLPILLLAVAAIGGSLALARLGMRRAMIAGLVVIAASSGLRGTFGVSGLFGATVALGIGIAVLQPALPAITQSWFPSMLSYATNVYANGIIVGESLGASLTLPLVVPLTGSWQGALAAWGLLPLLAVVILLTPIGSVQAVIPPKSTGWWPRWSDSLTWRAGLLQGGSSILFFGTNAFLPTELHATGQAGLVAPSLAALNTAQLAASLVVALLVRHRSRPHALLAICGLGSIVGIGAIVFMPGWPQVVGAAIVGICSAVPFVVALALPALMATPEEVHRLAAGMFAIGYTSAFLFPFAGGIAWDLTGRPGAAFIPAAVGAVFFGSALLWPGRSFRKRYPIVIR